MTKRVKSKYVLGLHFLCTKNRIIQVLQKYKTDIEKIRFLIAMTGITLATSKMISAKLATSNYYGEKLRTRQFFTSLFNFSSHTPPHHLIISK